LKTIASTRRENRTMLTGSGGDPGFLAISSRAEQPAPPDVVAIAASLAASFVDGVGGGVDVEQGPGWIVASWGLPRHRRAGDGRDPNGAGTTLWPLSRGVRRGESDLSPVDLLALFDDDDRSGFADLMPPFAALAASGSTISVATDAIGARHVYLARQPGWVALSTHAAALSLATNASLDDEAIAMQLMLGWQVGERTMFSGVTKLPAGSVAVLSRGNASVESFLPVGAPPPTTSNAAIDAAAEMLRTHLDHYLDDHPDATLQLTGGQDSRLLLSAIDPSRRRGLCVMTLAVAGSDDARIAGELADLGAMRHQVVTLDGIDDWEPAEALARTVASSRRLGCMADPLALAALQFAESKISQGPRISGLGGEVARGFYYALPSIPLPVTRRTVAALSDWRMFANESVTREALDPDFRAWADRFAHAEIHRLMTGSDLRSASDRFYLDQRMQRWAGVTDTAVCLERDVVNPMLDRRFLDIARGLSPADKRNSRFLGRLQIELDPELADIALDGRPPPRAYADGSFAGRATQALGAARQATRKSAQRIRQRHVPPAGGVTLARKIVDEWRRQPDVLNALAGSRALKSDWIQQVIDGRIEPDAATVSFMMNLIVAGEGCEPQWR
jgi:asparagine synthase (glutamine-hydrolysing)